MNIPYIHSHLIARGFDPRLYRVNIDERSLTATFLIWNTIGQLVGYQRYQPWKKKNGKRHTDLQYFTWATEGQFTIWGFEYLKPDSTIVFLTEGIFDAVKILNAGYPALAMLGNAGSKSVRAYLRLLPYTFVAICDNDAAGKELAKSGDLWYNTPIEFKDLGEMPQETATKWIGELCHSIGS